MRRFEDIAIVINARMESTRIKNKILRPFCDTTLLDICLNKIDQITCCKKYLATCEKKIIDISQNHNITVLNRSYESVEKGRASQIITFQHYLSVPERYVMSINVCCPFTKVSTYEKAIYYFITNKEIKTLTTLKERNNIFFYSNKKPINVCSKDVSTQGNSKIYEMAQIFHIMDTVFFEQYGFFWNYEDNNPDFFMVDGLEVFDIDFLDEFVIAEAIYEKGIA